MARLDSVTIRRARRDEAAAIAAVHVAAWHESYTGLLPQRIIEQRTKIDVRTALWDARLARLARPNGAVFVAANASGICGFAAAAPMPDELPYGRDPLPGFDAYLESLYSLAAVHRQGIGRRLLRHVAEALTVTGSNSMVLHVFGANPARGFYEHLGAELIREEHMQDGEDSWLQCVYGWRTLAPLLIDRRT
jgi:GNAT superfamily N-acetyltransferase